MLKSTWGLYDCSLRCSHSVDKEMKPRGVTQLTQSQTTVGNEANVFVVAGKSPFHVGVYGVWKTDWVLGKGTAQE